jgi:hypothetical protein
MLGALATLCALDLATNVLPIVNARLAARRARRLRYGLRGATRDAASIDLARSSVLQRGAPRERLRLRVR